jgi:predicted Zn finger-like uncharacterized protein
MVRPFRIETGVTKNRLITDGVTMLVFNCDDCGAQLKLRDESAGKKVRCPSCKSVVAGGASYTLTVRER